MNNLRQAAQQAILLCQWIDKTPHQRGSINGMAAQVKHALEQALAEPEQPVEYVRDEDNPCYMFTAPTPQPEQKVWCDCGDSIEPDSGAKCGNCVAGDSAEPEQEPVAWVELTDEEQLELARDSMGRSRHWLVAQVEAKLKEKNSAPTPRKPQTTHWEGCEAVHPECKAKAAPTASQE